MISMKHLHKRLRRLGAMVLVLGLLGAASWAGDVVKDQHAALGPGGNKTTQTTHNTHPDAQWYGRGNFGLFLHWGISSVEAKHELSWAIMDKESWNPHPIKPVDYYALAARFDPRRYDADKWIKAAKEAGFTYAVLTTRHHDGYAMWPSKFGEMNTKKSGGQDLVRPYVEACRKYGLKVGLYYSPQDWYFDRQYRSFGNGTAGTPDNPHLGMRHEPVTLPAAPPAEHVAAQKAYVRGQITELLTRYGKIDVLWFDGGNAWMSIEEIRKLQPGILINNRINWNRSNVTTPYDIDTSNEGSLPKERPEAPWWECCMTAVGSWAYIQGNAENPRPAEAILSDLVKVRAWGGNYLVNFAPMADGRMPESYYARMKEIGAWMKTNGPAVIGTQGGDWPEKSNVPVTRRGRTWFLHATPDFKEEKLVLADAPGQPKSVKLRSSGQRLEFKRVGPKVEITLPKAQRSALPDVVDVHW